MNIRIVVCSLVLGLSLCAGANASSIAIGYNPHTGDMWLDAQLGQVNVYGRDDGDYFIDDIVISFGAPRYLVRELYYDRRWAPGDIYYACAIAYQVRRPCTEVVHVYEKDRGQGWGVIAQRMGIKPGSAQFHALKGQVGKSNDKFKAHGHGQGQGNRMDGDRHDRGPGKSDDHGPGRSGDHGPGNSDKAKGKYKDKGNGKGKGKDKGEGP